MSELSHISKAFQSIIDAADNESFSLTHSDVAACDACEVFQSALANTILPRRITIRSERGARLSVVVKNRRIVKVAEAHPEGVWTGKSSPQDTACEASYDTFGAIFAAALLEVVDDQTVSIEQSLLTDPLEKTARGGYPASSLTEHVAKAAKGEPDAAVIKQFYDTFSIQPRALFGTETETVIPEESLLDKDWVQARLNEVKTDQSDTDLDLSLMIADGDKPVAMVVARRRDEGCVVLSDNPEHFDALERDVGNLRSHF